MWNVVFDKWSEKWVVAEYSREDGTHHWYSDAVLCAEQKNRRMHQHPTSSKSEYTEYDTEEATDIWPGGAVTYGVSYG